MDIPDTTEPNYRWWNRIISKLNLFKPKSDKVGFLFIFVLAITFLVVKVTPDAQKSVFSAFFNNYIEETAASVIRPTFMQLADINSLSLFDGRGLVGGSGQEKSFNRQILATIQDNSVVSFNSVTTDTAKISKQFTGETNQISIYTVQEGDNLSFIAQDYGVSVNTLIWANNIRNVNYLRPGTELKIPPISGVIHTVKSGETLSGIASKYDVEQENILAYNRLPRVDSIKRGQEIIIPGGRHFGNSYYQNSECYKICLFTRPRLLFFSTSYRS